MSLDITNVFKSEKRDLTNNSKENGESCKRQCEERLDDSSVSEKILRDIAQTTQENQIKGTAQLIDLQEAINFIIEKLQEYEQDRRKKGREIEELEENISTLSNRLDDLDSVIGRQEQYSRRNCPLLYRIEEESNENTNQ